MDEAAFSSYVGSRRTQLFRTACLLCGDRIGRRTSSGGARSVVRRLGPGLADGQRRRVRPPDRRQRALQRPTPALAAGVGGRAARRSHGARLPARGRRRHPVRRPRPAPGDRAAHNTRSHLCRGNLEDDLVLVAVRVRLIEIGEAVKALNPDLTEPSLDPVASGCAYAGSSATTASRVGRRGRVAIPLLLSRRRALLVRSVAATQHLLASSSATVP